MKVLDHIVDFIKMSKIWSLSMEFYGAWQLLAMHHRTHLSVSCGIDHTINHLLAWYALTLALVTPNCRAGSEANNHAALGSNLGLFVTLSL